MISGRRGSGTIFFANCCLHCLFCQNYEISQGNSGREIEIEELAQIMLDLQNQAAHNINLVTPTHFAPQIVAALEIARQRGLKLPIVYNTGGYDSLELVRSLSGKIDVYLPDLKYASEEMAIKYSGAENYIEVAKAAVAEMFRQVGNIQLNKDKVAVKGVLVRHLVLPNGLAQSKKILDYLAELSKDIWLSLMSQYSPQYQAAQFPEIGRPLQAVEYKELVDYAEELGLHNIYIQELESQGVYLPDFKASQPFNQS